MAITAALSSEVDKGWFEAQCNTPEEAEAMYATHKAKQTMEQMASMPGGM